jgi:hypothetical protein
MGLFLILMAMVSTLAVALGGVLVGYTLAIHIQWLKALGWGLLMLGIGWLTIMFNAFYEIVRDVAALRGSVGKENE